MTVDRQLPLEPTERIDPTTQVDRMPGTDAVCICGEDDCHPPDDCAWPPGICGWPFCPWKEHTDKEDEMHRSDELCAIVHESEDTFAKGWVDALRAYSWMKDGTIYVGTTGQTFEGALERFLADRGYTLPVSA